MSPEKGIIQGSIINEAQRIAPILLRMQHEMDEAARQTKDELLQRESIRQQLGYREPAPVDVSGVIDMNIESKTPVVTPELLADALPLTEQSVETTRQGRLRAAGVLVGRDDRLLVVVGPCSIHDPAAALEYAEQVAEWREEYNEDLEILMRAYPEKPRTELGWKGFVNDPLIDGSNDMNVGLIATRMLACQITNSGVPIAMERLNALTPQYVNGLVSYDAIGARNTTDQKAREYASGTSSVVGFKNTPEGSVDAAVSAVVSANAPHTFLGMAMSGGPMQVNTTGNKIRQDGHDIQPAHVILRGDDNGPNYDEDHVSRVKIALRQRGLLPAVVIDASHGNSVVEVGGKRMKHHKRQLEVIRSVREQLTSWGETAIRGVMIESNLIAGRQEPMVPSKELQYGQSITDSCVNLVDTSEMLAMLSEAVQARRCYSGRV